MKPTNLLWILSVTITLQLFVAGCNLKDGSSTSENLQTTASETSVQPASQTSENQTKDAGKETKPALKVDEAKATKLTDTAKLFAGMKVDEKSPLKNQEKTQAWNDHAYYFDSSWKKLDAQQLSKVRKWSTEELKTVKQASAPLFYPFSGPDFLYAYSFFPKANEYVLVGLEPVGKIADLASLSDAQLNREFQEVNTALNAILQLSFFRTNDMKVDLAEKGVLPLLFVFLARTNNRLLDLEYIRLQKDATVQVVESSSSGDQTLIPGVRISFLPEGETQPKTLYYFSLDLSNEGLAQTPEFVEFVKKFPEPNTYLKAASYLMHRDNFSEIRDLILAQSASLLQDDSGMPVKYVDSQKWDRKFYGTYTQPIDLFSVRYQSDLREIYSSNQDIKPLDFGIGYQFGVNESNLMLAISKEKS
jgi:hypothetical protein